jgi:hypothetical protein
MHPELSAITTDNAGTFLSPMLEGVKTVVRQFGGIGMSENAENAAVMFWIMHSLRGADGIPTSDPGSRKLQTPEQIIGETGKNSKAQNTL